MIASSIGFRGSDTGIREEQKWYQKSMRRVETWDAMLRPSVRLSTDGCEALSAKIFPKNSEFSEFQNFPKSLGFPFLPHISEIRCGTKFFQIWPISDLNIAIQSSAMRGIRIWAQNLHAEWHLHGNVNFRISAAMAMQLPIFPLGPVLSETRTSHIA